MSFGPGSCWMPSVMTFWQTGSSHTPSPFESYFDCAISALAFVEVAAVAGGRVRVVVLQLVVEQTVGQDVARVRPRQRASRELADARLVDHVVHRFPDVDVVERRHPEVHRDVRHGVLLRMCGGTAACRGWWRTAAARSPVARRRRRSRPRPCRPCCRGRQHHRRSSLRSGRGTRDAIRRWKGRTKGCAPARSAVRGCIRKRASGPWREPRSPGSHSPRTCTGPFPRGIGRSSWCVHRRPRGPRSGRSGSAGSARWPASRNATAGRRRAR